MTASIFEGAAYAEGRSRALNRTEWEAGSEVDALAQLLHPGENVEHLARGPVERLRQQVDFLENLIHGPQPTQPERLP